MDSISDVQSFFSDKKRTTDFSTTEGVFLVIHSKWRSLFEISFIVN